MELRQLEYFVAVAEEGNFTRAAERVHISQSGVSAQIQQLERELGAPLLDRSGRTTTLTPAGVAALEHARAALASVIAVGQAVDDVNQLVRGQLVVGMVVGCTVTPLFDALAAFHHAHPGVAITLAEDSSDRLVDQVRAGSVDLALIGSSATTPSDLDALSIARERLVAVVPDDHPLARRTKVRLATLVAHPIVSLPTGTGIRAVFDEGCAARGLAPAVALQASAPDAVIDLARRGFGAAILSESMADDLGDGLCAVLIDDIRIPALLALVWAPVSSPALRALVGRCATAFGLDAPSAGSSAGRSERSARQPARS